MAREPTIPDPVRETMRQGGVDVGDEDIITGKKKRKKKTDDDPLFRKLGSSRIPTSKHLGKVWKSRRDIALRRRESSGIREIWEEAIRYYDNDQMSHRDDVSGGRVAGNRTKARRINDEVSETENIVYANTNTLISILYAKNPEAEITPIDEADEDFAVICERLVNVIASKPAAPGVNLKIKGKRSLLHALLTNRGYIEVDYIRKQYSAEQALATINELSTAYAEAKDPKELEEIEGKLIALEETIDVLNPSGPIVRVRHPATVLVDPAAECEDLSDANWVMYSDMLDVNYVRAMYGKEGKDEKGEWMLQYQPTHVLQAGGNDSLDEEINTFSILEGEEDDKSAKAFGFDDDTAFDRAKRIKVWYVWDKVTRRVFLFNDKDWAYPIWVWDDPLELDCFFPLAPIWIYTGISGVETKGEVTYYLDQQDAVNEMLSEERRARLWARKNIFFNTNVITADQAAAFLRGDNDAAQGLDLPEGSKITDHIFAMVPPSMQFAELFNPARKLEAIDRVSSVKAVQRGAEFKTNTTNRAIEEYTANQNTRLDEKIDAVEDFIGRVMWMLLQLCLMNMEQEDVAPLLGDRDAQKWQRLSKDEITKKIQFRVVGGSTAKPTSRAKKEEALEMAQILGQFARANPVSLVIALRAMERAFDEVTVTAEDWRMITEGMMAQMQQGAPGPSEQSPGGGGDSAGGGDPMEAIARVVDQLPPQAKQALGNALAKGVPVREALPRILQAAQKQGNGSAQPAA